MIRRKFLQLSGLLSTQFFLPKVLAKSRDYSFYSDAVEGSAATGISASPPVQIPYEKWVEEHIEIWNSQAVHFRLANQIPFLPGHNRIFPMGTRTSNAQNLSNYQKQVEAEYEQLPRNSAGKKQWTEEQRQNIKTIGRSMFSFSEKDTAALEKYAFFGGFGGYLDRVTQVDPSITPADIYQAGRNVMTATGLQVLAGQTVNSHDAILGYSLLYPYTDNFLDNSNVGPSQRLKFVERFQARLAGESVSPSGEHEGKVFKAIEMIESIYPRHSYPDVYRSLLTIHHAQIDAQKDQNQSVLDKKVSRESLYRTVSKGGSSVLADAFLTDGRPAMELARFGFSLGVALQFIDDLQDVEYDYRRKSLTSFTSAVSAGRDLDDLTLQLLNFCNVVIDRCPHVPALPAGDFESLKSALKAGTFFLIAESVNANPTYFSDFFRVQLMARLPLAIEWRRQTVEQQFVYYWKQDPTRMVDLMSVL